MELRDSDKTTVNLIPGNISMVGDTVLVQYIVESWSLEHRDKAHPSHGLQVILVLKRRIINELLTSYLPSILILSIVYATNFFKPFFFESVISTNLTSQLVLTTLFISVSQSLPPTAYVKMIDLWLIFAQLIPFLEVLLHTFMDALREDEDREINHHGKPMEVGEKEENAVFHKTDSNERIIPIEERASVYSVSKKLINSKLAAPNEKEQMAARRAFYKDAKVNEKYLQTCEFLAKKGIPILILSFSLIYWSYGLYYYFYSG